VHFKNKLHKYLISITFFLLGDTPASEFYMPV